MAKQYKISFKTYLNQQLREVKFHGKSTHPLYCMVNYRRSPIYFKSAIFDLLSGVRFQSVANGRRMAPSMAFVERVENEHLSYAIDRSGSEFSLEGFKQKYTYYTTDLCMSMEEGIRAVLSLYFSEQGLPSIGRAILESSSSTVLYILLQELYRVLQPAVVKRLQKDLSGLLPYQDLYAYVSANKKISERIFTIRDWEQERERFIQFQKAQHRDIAVADRIDRWAQEILSSIRTGRP